MKLKIRLALREEGSFYCAYMAHHNTMDNAKLIGSIAMGAVQQSPEIKQQFMELMKQVMGHAIETVIGEAPDHWITQPAPEIERGGNA